MNNLVALKDRWFRNLAELKEEIQEIGYDIDECNREYIVVSAEDDDEEETFELRLGGTERTITIEKISEVA